MKLVFLDLLGLVYNGDTLKTKGLGGSESAVILLSKELAKLGFEVTVICNCDSPGIYDGVIYLDHSQEYTNTPDIFISSRSVLPFWSGHKYTQLAFSAKKRIVWLHDTFCEGEQDLEPMLVQGFIDEVFTLSDFHTNYVLNCDHGQKRNFEVLKHKFWQTRNGAVCHISEVDVSKKDPAHFVYNASATKGMIPLINDIWPKVRMSISQAHLTVIGGFYRFKDSKPDAQEITVRNLMNKGIPGVTFTGVIPQHEIAELLADASFTLYPTAFPETFGISTLESLLYRTPVITSRFGALEETAIDLACYKIDYSATPNSLFPNINAVDQARKFVQTTIAAHKDRYLLSQKQQYCDVVKDIAGWDSVAKEWKQHFYQMLDEFLPVSEYRETKKITDKVNRVFGRRISNKSARFSSYGSQRRIVVISPYWNASQYLCKHVKSISSQDYDNYLHILIDDASTDSPIIDSVETDHWIRVVNENNVGAIANQLWAVNKYVKDDDIVIFLDGDDWLANDPSIFHLYNDLYSSGVDFTYGSTWSLADNIPLIAQTYPSEVIKNKTFRQHKFAWGIPYTHLRTVKGSLCKNLDESKFKDESGGWMKAGADAPLFYELIERASNPMAVKEIVHCYNDKNPLNDYKIRGEEQNRNAGRSNK